MITSTKPTFWVVNISKLNVSLSDLSLTIPPGRKYNLLDTKHFKYSLEQLEKSATSGSLFKKSDKIKKCGTPSVPTKVAASISTEARDVRRATLYRAEIENFDELPNIFEDQRVSDQKFAEEYATDQ